MTMVYRSSFISGDFYEAPGKQRPFGSGDSDKAEKALRPEYLFFSRRNLLLPKRHGQPGSASEAESLPTLPSGLLPANGPRKSHRICFEYQTLVGSFGREDEALERMQTAGAAGWELVMPLPIHAFPPAANLGAECYGLLFRRPLPTV